MQRINKNDWGRYYPDKDILGVELRNSNKYFLQANEGGYVSVNLKNLEDTKYADSDLSTGLDSMYEEGKKLYKFNTMKEMIAWATS